MPSKNVNESGLENHNFKSMNISQVMMLTHNSLLQDSSSGFHSTKVNKTQILSLNENDKRLLNPPAISHTEKYR